MGVCSVLYVRLDGQLFGGVARAWKVVDVYYCVANRRVLVPRGMVIDCFSCIPYVGDDLYFLSDFLDFGSQHRFYHYTNAYEKIDKSQSGIKNNVKKPDANTRRGYFHTIIQRGDILRLSDDSVCLFKRSDASCANVTVGFFAVSHVGNFLNVYFERSSRFTVGVANVVARCLTFTANIAYS